MIAFDILSQLNPNQQATVTHGKGPLLILAGAGSGKTRALTYRAAYLIKERAVPPENILLVTFTNKAADEMKQRLRQLVGAIPQFTSTFHSFCARVLRHDGHYLKIAPGFTIYDKDDQLQAIKLAMKKIDLDPKRYRPPAVLTTISQAKNELISAMEYPQYARGDFQNAVARVYLTYRRLLMEFGALDFDDLLFETVRLFQKEKAVLTKYQNYFQHILVDEYQDTNTAQYLLTKLLAKAHQNLCVVGDASQAIYGWRGANYRNLVNLKQDFPNLTIINLEQNYRSTKTILAAANQVIKKNTTHPILKLWTDRDQGEKISLVQTGSETEEALFIAKEITKSLGFGDYQDFVVLYRTNAQSRAIEEVFLKAGIPYTLVGGVRFYERKEIKDCLAYLRLLVNPQDRVAKERIEKLGQKRWGKFNFLVSKLKKQSLNKLVTVKLLDQILEKVNYYDLFDPKDEQDFARIENIKELRSVATQFPDIDQFLENVALVQQEYLPAGETSLPDYSKNAQTKKGVTLMTAHAAKGTEFPIVFMVGMEEGLFPHSRSMIGKEELEEERRLCYVGMTRAKEKLYLTYTNRRLYFGQRASNPVSRFIEDIPTELIEFEKQNFDTMESN